MSLGIISGTGLYDFALLAGGQKSLIKTPYGQATVYENDINGRHVVFLPRHGKGHSLPPHLINYRANICALSTLGVRDVLALCCVGSLKSEFGPGSLVLLEQFIDQTWGREMTFAAPGAVDHVDMTVPYCPRLSQSILKAADSCSLAVKTGGIYICAQGPRFETPAEIKAFAAWGANLVGMTGVPEAPLAREAGLCYAALAVVANYAAGLNQEESVDGDEISRIMDREKDHLENILRALISSYEPADCLCAQAKVSACRRW
jgi:5'-methylthioadenosine phosphorylase